MGRKLDLSKLTKDEQAEILRVVQRDFALRKKEDKRVREKQNVVTPKQGDKDPSKCVVCNSSFIWLLNPKVECMVCRSFFCKSKTSCGNNDQANFEWICSACLEVRELHLQSLSWFYSNLKSRFRRHGGGKILREFYKHNKKDKSSTDSGFLSTSEVTLEAKDGTDGFDKNLKNPPEFKEELERAIVSSLIPKIEEINTMQKKQNKSQATTQELEQLLEKILKEMSEQQEQSYRQNDNDLLWRYLKDHKQYLMMRILKEIGQLQNTRTEEKTNKLTLRDVETMTEEEEETEMESTSSYSGSFRSRSSYSPFWRFSRTETPSSSMYGSQHDARNQTFFHGVISKENKVTGSDVKAAVAEILAEPVDVPSYEGREFITELNFTAVDDGIAFSDEITLSRKSSDSSQDENRHLDLHHENWTIAPPKPRARMFLKKPTYLPANDSCSAYSILNKESNLDYNSEEDTTDDDNIEENALELEILPVTIRKDLSEVSARSLGADHCEYNIKQSPRNRRKTKDKVALMEISDYLSLDGNENRLEQNTKNSEKPSTSAIEEPKIVPTTQEPQSFSSADKFHIIEEKRTVLSERKSNKNLQISSDNTTSGDYDKVENNNKYSPSAIYFQEIRQKKSAEENLNSSECHIDAEEMLDLAFEEAYRRQVKDPGVLEEDQDSSCVETIPLEQTIYQCVNSGGKSETKSGKLSANYAKDNANIHSSSESEFVVSCNEENNVCNENGSPEKGIPYHQSLNKNLTSQFEDFSVPFAFSTSSDVSSDVDEEEYRTSSMTSSFSNDTASLVVKEQHDDDDVEVKSRKSIQELMGDLQTAGLSAKATKFNRASLNSHGKRSSVSPLKQQDSNPKKSATPPVVNAQSPYIDWELYSFRVDPANFKKRKKLSRETSLSSLILSDNESSFSDNTVSSKGITSPKNQSSEVLPSVAQRRSVYDRTKKISFNEDRGLNDEPQSIANESEVVKEFSDCSKNSRNSFTIPSLLIVENTSNNGQNSKTSSIKESSQADGPSNKGFTQKPVQKSLIDIESPVNKNTKSKKINGNTVEKSVKCSPFIVRDKSLSGSSENLQENANLQWSNVVKAANGNRAICHSFNDQTFADANEKLRRNDKQEDKCEKRVESPDLEFKPDYFTLSHDKPKVPKCVIKESIGICPVNQFENTPSSGDTFQSMNKVKKCDETNALPSFSSSFKEKTQLSVSASKDKSVTSGKPVNVRCINDLPTPSRRTLIEEGTAFNRSSPLRGSLTMRGSVGNRLTSTAGKKVTFHPSQPIKETSDDHLVPETLVLTLQ